MFQNFLLGCLVFLIFITSNGEVSKAASKENFCNSREMTSAVENENSGERSQGIKQKDFYEKWAISKVVAYGRVNAGEDVARAWLGEKIIL